MKAVFISDAHLKKRYTEGYENLLCLLDFVKEDLTDLFIVGDFFDFWFCGNGNIYPEFQTIINKLLELKDRGITINLFEGNHDFFLEEFFGTHGINVFPDGAAVNMDEKTIFVSHGDTIDTTNKPYLFLRHILRSRVFYETQKYLPSPVLWKIAAASSKMSKDHLARPLEGLTEKMKAFSMKKFEEDFDAVILGHCHQPVIEQYLINGRKRTFAILGDWINCFTYLLYNDGDFVLSEYKSK